MDIIVKRHRIGTTVFEFTSVFSYVYTLVDLARYLCARSLYFILDHEKGGIISEWTIKFFISQYDLSIRLETFIKNN